MISLREKDKTTLFEMFAKYDFPFEVWAYGSRVNGKSHDGSDLDLVIRSLSELPFPKEIYFEMKNQLKYGNIPIFVDLFIWESLPETFHKNILESYEVFYKK